MSDEELKRISELEEALRELLSVFESFDVDDMGMGYTAPTGKGVGVTFMPWTAVARRLSEARRILEEDEEC